MLMRVTPRVKKQENNLEMLGDCPGANQVSDGATAPSSPALAPPLILFYSKIK